MKLDKEKVNTIRELFRNIQSKRDFLYLINLVGTWIYEKDFKEISLKKLTYFGNKKLGGVRYTSFSIQKKSGDSRLIQSPVHDLLLIQQILNHIFQNIYEFHPSSYGFQSEKSIVDNSKVHVGQRYVN